MSPRPGPRRKSVTIRLSESELRLLDDWARTMELTKSNGDPNRSEAIQRLIREHLHVLKEG